MTEENPPPEKRPAKSRENPFFKLVILATAIFVFTMLVLVATFMGDPNHAANRFIQKFAGSLIAAEVAVIMVTGFLAMYFDRRENRTNGNQSLEKPFKESKQD